MQNIQQPRQLTNPHSPPALAGVPGNAPAGYVDAAFSYTYDKTLTGSQFYPNEQVKVDTDADFMWRAVLLAKADGAFSVRFFDSTGYSVSSGQVHSSNLSANPSAPAPWFPEVPIPAGGTIGLEITELSGQTNDIQILFIGVKRYKIPQ